MSNNMCSLENGSTKHSMSAIVSSCSPSFTCSPLTSKTFGSHLFGSMPSPLPLPPPSSHTAFPFPPNPLFLSSMSLFNPQWFSAHNSLNTPLSLTTNDTKEMSNNFNDNNNNITKIDNKYKDSTQSMLSQNKSNLSDNHNKSSDSSVTTTPTAENTSQQNLSTAESDRNPTRNHSDNLNWLAEVAISSKGLQSIPSSPLNPQPTHPSHGSQRGLYHPMANDMTAGQRMYSPRFGSANSPTYFPYSTPNSPINHQLNTLNGVRGGAPLGTSPSQSSGHYSGSYVSSFNYQQTCPQFSPTTAQNAISPFLVPNQLSVANTRPQTYTTGTIDSYHQNSHSHSQNAILSANSSSITSHSGLSTSSRSPSLHSSDSSSRLSSGPFSSPPISSEPSEPQTKSMMRSIKDSIDCHNDIRSGAHESTGIKRKSPSSPELNSTEKNLYKLPFGREGSRKHRILKPPNISILEPNKLDPMSGQSAPLSAPPIPVVRRQDFLKRISDSDIHCYSSESIVEPKNCHNITPFSHQRRKSVPQTSVHKSLPSLTAGDTPNEDSQYMVPNENCLPIDGHNRLQYPVYFRKGSIIQLANGSVKRVEEMSTQDFIESATDSPDLCADCSEVIKIEEKIKSCSVLLSFSVGRTKVPVTVEAPVEHPFFVFHKGWSSFSPERSQLRYGLKCRKLRVGDNCVSLTPRTTSAPNLTQSTQKNHKIANKISITGDMSRNVSKLKPMSTNPKKRSPIQPESPLSLVKSSPNTSTANEIKSESKPLKPKELLVNRVDTNESKREAKVSDTSIPSDNVPMSSSDSEPPEAVKTVNRNRRHSAPDAIEASEPSNAS